MGLKALLFDVDGTLAETEELHRRSFNQAFQQRGLDWYWDETLYGELLSVAGGVERMCHYAERFELDETSCGEAFFKQLHRQKKRIYQELISSLGISLKPGIETLIGQARAEDIRLALVTSSNGENVRQLIRVTLGEEALGWFEVWVTGERVVTKKPDGTCYSLAVKELGLSPQDCLAIEDAEQGLRAARSVGVPTVITVSAYTGHDDFSDALFVFGLDDTGFTFERLKQLHCEYCG